MLFKLNIGRSSVFVQIFLMPAFAFSENEKINRTETRKQTLDPVFNETIKL